MADDFCLTKRSNLLEIFTDDRFATLSDQANLHGIAVNKLLLTKKFLWKTDRFLWKV